jgi:hypothetical protein
MVAYIPEVGLEVDVDFAYAAGASQADGCHSDASQVEKSRSERPVQEASLEGERNGPSRH